MVATPSTMLELGTPIPDFALPNVVDGRKVTPRDFEGKRALLVMFICNHCPYVKHVKDELTRLGRDYRSRDVGIVAINSNDVAKYPDDGPEQMKALALSEGWWFPFLLDEAQSVARAFKAACTPDFFLFDGEGRLAYRGQLDASRPRNDVPVTGADLRAALDAVLGGEPVPAEQVPSLGCNIKWKPGNEPDYFG
ncbi:MAG: thioredoxin family protein [Gemmatimonadota bacterium]|nr:MAG: thioredoxin family protein [Gemmatimonadota bacterium]